MKERTKIEHVRKNKNVNLDYILVYDYTLQKEMIKPLGDIKVFDNEKIIKIIYTLTEELKKEKENVKALEERLSNLEVRINNTDKVIEKIIKEKLKL